MDVPVEQVRLFQVDCVAGLREYHQTRPRDGTLHEDGGIDAMFIFIPDHNEGRDLKPAQSLL